MQLIGMPESLMLRTHGVGTFWNDKPPSLTVKASRARKNLLLARSCEQG